MCIYTQTESSFKYLIYLLISKSSNKIYMQVINILSLYRLKWKCLLRRIKIILSTVVPLLRIPYLLQNQTPKTRFSTLIISWALLPFLLGIDFIALVKIHCWFSQANCYCVFQNYQTALLFLDMREFSEIPLYSFFCVWIEGR